MAYRSDRYGDPARQLERIQLAKIRGKHRCASCVHGKEVLEGLAECHRKPPLKWPKQGFCYGWSLNEQWRPPVKEGN